MHRALRHCAVVGCLLSASSVAAQHDTLAKWWDNKLATGSLFGFRDARDDHGLTLGGRWRGLYLGVVSSENGSGSFFTQELSFAGRLDLAKLTDLAGLEGLVAFGSTRYREPGYWTDPNNDVDGLSLFNPSRFAGGTGWRLLEFGLEYTTPELFGIEELLEFKAGWLRPRTEFMDQQYTNFFVNNATATGDSVGANIPFSTSFSTWGGTVEIKPVDWQYTKLALFMSYPQGTDSNNNGLMFQGYAPDTSQNGLWLMGETGALTELGARKLRGEYAVGAYLYQNDASGSGGNETGLYLDADQLLYAEPGENPASAEAQGLAAGALLAFAPPYNNEFPIFVEGALIYQGLIPERDRDETIIGFAWAPAQQTEGASYGAALEAGYRFRFSGWGWIQPYAQYLIQPDGTPDVANAAVLGVFAGIDF